MKIVKLLYPHRTISSKTFSFQENHILIKFQKFFDYKNSQNCFITLLFVCKKHKKLCSLSDFYNIFYDYFNDFYWGWRGCPPKTISIHQWHIKRILFLPPSTTTQIFISNLHKKRYFFKNKYIDFFFTNINKYWPYFYFILC